MNSIGPESAVTKEVMVRDSMDEIPSLAQSQPINLNKTMKTQAS